MSHFSCPGSMVLGPGFWVQGLGSKVLGIGFRVMGSGSRVLGPGLGWRAPEGFAIAMFRTRPRYIHMIADVGCNGLV